MSRSSRVPAVLTLCMLLGFPFVKAGETKKQMPPPGIQAAPAGGPTNRPAPTGAAPLPPAQPPLPDAKPWYKSPAGITTLVVVHVAALAILLSGDGESSASPSQPPASR